jgi:hypothetical protein
MKVIKPNGEVYCEFSVDENCIYIEFKPGYKLSLDRKVIPDLKKFLESIEPEKKHLIEADRKKIFEAFLG